MSAINGFKLSDDRQSVVIEWNDSLGIKVETTWSIPKQTRHVVDGEIRDIQDTPWQRDW